MTRRRWIIIVVAVAMLVVGSVFFVVWWQWQAGKESGSNTTPEQSAQAAALASVLGSPYEKIVFFGIGEGSNDVYAATTNTGMTAPVPSDGEFIYSNFLADSGVWYSIHVNQLVRYTLAGSTTMRGALPTTVTAADTLGIQNSLAVDSAEQYIAWVTTAADDTESIQLYNLTTQQTTELFAGEPGTTYGNLTWSPESTELGFTVDATQFITVTTDGAQLYNPVSLPFSQMQFLTWLERDQIGCVVTSTDTNPEPFAPYVAVFDRTGTVTEQHNVLDKVGVPKVVWSADGKEFLFLDPWRNLFMVYDRYDIKQAELVVEAPGKLVPFGWTLGEKSQTNISAANVNTNTSSVNNTAATFTVSADEWDQYNNTVRAILEQFKVDFSTYRFAVTDNGFEISFTLAPDQTQPEMAVVQTVLQIFAVIPDVPSVTLHVILPDGATPLTLNVVTREQAQNLVDRFTIRPLEELFVVNKNNSVGKRAAKPDQPGYHYIGDLVYSNFGDYNADPALAYLGATFGEQQFYTAEDISFLYPTTWDSREIDDATTLLYTPETIFASPTAWSNFGVTVKRYDTPGVTFDQWLGVNRSDQTLEDAGPALHQPLEAKHVVAANTYSDEYILYANGNVYVIHLERDAGMTAVDTVVLQNIIQSFTDHYAFQRD